MRNFILDWNNMNAVIVKKSYLSQVQSGKGSEALEAEKLRQDGFTLKNGTKYTIGEVSKKCINNNFFSKALPSV